MIVALGSTAGTVKDTVDDLRDEGHRVGLLRICSFRPFPATAVAAALHGIESVIVLDRADSPGGTPPLHAELAAALYGSESALRGHVYGLGGRELHPKTSARSSRRIAAPTWVCEVRHVQPEDPRAQPGRRAATARRAFVVPGLRHPDGRSDRAEHDRTAGRRCERDWMSRGGHHPVPDDCLERAVDPRRVRELGRGGERHRKRAARARASPRLPNGEVAIVVFAGDGGTYDIGLQALSGAMERGHRFLSSVTTTRRT